MMDQGSGGYGGGPSQPHHPQRLPPRSQAPQQQQQQQHHHYRQQQEQHNPPHRLTSSAPYHTSQPSYASPPLSRKPQTDPSHRATHGHIHDYPLRGPGPGLAYGYGPSPSQERPPDTNPSALHGSYLGGSSYGALTALNMSLSTPSSLCSDGENNKVNKSFGSGNGTPAAASASATPSAYRSPTSAQSVGQSGPGPSGGGPAFTPGVASTATSASGGVTGGTGGSGGMGGGTGGGTGAPKNAKSGGAAEFVKKLYRMLEDPAFETIVSWGRGGDSFVVKDMNDFTKIILPRSFRHSNFASFVRQLNKYDFHKVKNPDDGSGSHGEHIWEFRHPSFRVDTQDSLESIKRKPPASKKPPGDPLIASAGVTGASGALAGGDADAAQRTELQSQVEALGKMQAAMDSHVQGLTRDYQAVLAELMRYRRNFAAQDQVMQNMIQYLITLESDKRPDSLGAPFVPSEQAQKLIASYTDAARASFEQMDEISHRAISGPLPPSATPLSSLGPGNTGHEYSIPAPQPHYAAAPVPGTNIIHHPPPGDGGRGTENRPGSSSERDENSPQSSASGPPDYESPTTLEGQWPVGGGAGAGDSNGFAGQRTVEQEGNSGLPAFLLPGETSTAPATRAGSEGNSSTKGINHSSGGGLTVFTVGHLLPREDIGGYGGRGMDLLGGTVVPSLAELPKGMPALHKSEFEAYPAPVASGLASPQRAGVEGRANGSHFCGGSAGSINEGKPKLRVRRGTCLPGWAVPPRVLLVEDDAVCRKLSSKFLQVFGCAIDVAVDGVTAVSKMNLEKYDLVLMDIVLPSLDGVSATSLIRQFDPMTPIISMTSNASSNEIMNYFHHGMNDILPKPFTKEGLLGMLEKHLMHMKAMQQMGEIPRALGFPGGEMQGAMHADLIGLPFSGMGIPDNDYENLLNGLASAEPQTGYGGMSGMPSAKRSRGAETEQDVKRGRFEEISACHV